MSIGLKGTWKTIIKFPTIILTAMFSIWTIGPVISTKSVCGIICYNGHQKLGVSICLTWINLLLTFSSGLAYSLWYEEGTNIIYFLTMSSPCLAISMIFLILLQCLDKCWSPGCFSPCLHCCDSYCYPVIELTYLDVNNMDSITTQDNNIELDQI